MELTNQIKDLDQARARARDRIVIARDMHDANHILHHQSRAQTDDYNGNFVNG